MKKLLVMLLCLLLLTTALSSCASGETLYAVDQDGRTYCVLGSNNRAKKILVKQGEETLWSTNVKVDKSVGRNGGNCAFYAEDLNFDGHIDLRLGYERTDNRIYYRCWLYDEAANTYVESEELTGLANLKVDTERKCLFGFDVEISSTPAPSPDFSDITVSTDAATKYIWEKGGLIPSIRVSLTYYSETDRYCYSVAYYNAETKQLETEPDMEKWMTSEEYLAADLDFLYYFR